MQVNLDSKQSLPTNCKMVLILYIENTHLERILNVKTVLTYKSHMYWPGSSMVQCYEILIGFDKFVY